MASVRVEALTKRFGDREVVNKVSFQVADGAFAVMLGPSGSGKTTLLRCIAGLELPDSGSVYIGDVLTDELSPRERDLSMVFQNYSLFPNMSVKANLAFPLVVRHRPRGEVEERVRRTAELLRIEQHLDKRPNQLSGGEQQRVSLGRAIIREPRAFLMDEPLSGLDAPLKLQMRAELKRVQRAPNDIDGVLDYTEDFGSTVIAHVKIGQDSISASIPPQESFELEAGARVGVQWDAAKLSFFDARSSERIV